VMNLEKLDWDFMFKCDGLGDCFRAKVYGRCGLYDGFIDTNWRLDVKV